MQFFLEHIWAPLVVAAPIWAISRALRFSS